MQEHSWSTIEPIDNGSPRLQPKVSVHMGIYFCLVLNNIDTINNKRALGWKMRDLGWGLFFSDIYVLCILIRKTFFCSCRCKCNFLFTVITSLLKGHLLFYINEDMCVYICWGVSLRYGCIHGLIMLLLCLCPPIFPFCVSLDWFKSQKTDPLRG